MEDELRSLLSIAVRNLKAAMNSYDRSKNAEHYSQIVVNLTDAIMMFKYHKEECDGEDWK